MEMKISNEPHLPLPEPEESNASDRKSGCHEKTNANCRLNNAKLAVFLAAH
jgi:hypothetical protein